MDETIVVKTDSDLPLKHQFGKMAVGSVAAFAANHAAEKLYEKVFYAIRARKAS